MQSEVPRQFHAGGISVFGDSIARAVERFGTPLYLYDERTLVDNLQTIRGAIAYPDTYLHFALVTNRAWKVLSTIARQGWHFHFNSPMEVEVVSRALELDGGFLPEQVSRVVADSVFSGGSITREQMADLVRRGVYLHVTACDQIAMFADLAPEGARDLGLRLQFDANMARARQGITEHDIDEALKIARERGVRITSAHMYRGTGTQSAEEFAAPFDRFGDLARRLPDLRYLDIGGGFGYDYRSRGQRFDWNELGARTARLMESLNQAVGRRLTLRLEVGRAAVASAGVFATRVVSRKRGFANREVLLGVDASSMSVRAAAPAVVGRRYHFAVATPRPGADRDEVYTLVGPTTYTNDYVAHRVQVAGAGVEGVGPGDALVVLDCGAYGAVTHSEFLTTPRPCEVMVTTGGALVELARRRGVEQVTSSWVPPVREPAPREEAVLTSA